MALLYTLIFWTSTVSGLLALDPYFFHIADIHYDPHYDNWVQYLWNTCNENVSQTQGNLGDFECDSPLELVKSSILAMQRSGREPDFILWTGDNTPHPHDHSWLDQQMVLEINQNITDLMLEAYPGVPFVVSIGNHDFYPVNQLPGNGHEIYQKLYEMWHPHWLNTTDIEDTFTKAAYYSMMLSYNPRVRAVVANTNLYYTSNDATDGEVDPGDQFQWLEELLEQARANNEKVHLIAHIPPGVMEVDSGSRFFKEHYNTRFNDIVRRYGDVMLGIYSCHSHFDTFRLFYDQDGKPTAAMLIAPSVTPWRARFGDDQVGEAHNPAVRKIHFDKDTYELVNVEQLYLDLNKYKDHNIADADWTTLYTYTGLYGVKNVSASELHSLVEQFKEYGDEQFHKYYDMNTVYTDHPSNGPCGCVCKNQHICSIQNVDYAAYDQCLLDMGATCGSADVISNIYIVGFMLSILLMQIF